MESFEERIQKYVQTFPPAVSGSGGQKVLWDCALKLIVGFDLTAEQAAAFLLAYWNERCEPPWTPKEILRTCESVWKKAPVERGTLLERGERSQAVKALPPVEYLTIITYYDVYEWKRKVSRRGKKEYISSRITVERVVFSFFSKTIQNLQISIPEILEKTPDPIPLKDFWEMLKGIKDGTLKPINSTVASVEVYKKS